jgi:hypothetical protein
MKIKAIVAICLLLGWRLCSQTNKPYQPNQVALEYKSIAKTNSSIKPWELFRSVTNTPAAKKQPHIPVWMAEPAFIKKMDEIATSYGRAHVKVNIARVEPDAITFLYSITNQAIVMGTFRIRFSDASTNLQQQFGFSPQKASEYETHKAQLVAQYRMYQVELQRNQTQLDYEIAQQKYEEAKQQYDDFIAEEQIEAFQRIADAQERQADALEEQNSQQQMQQIDSDIQLERIREKLNDIDWDLQK